jgi:hypothetical protein
VAGKRRRWRVWQRFMDPARFVFVDETGPATNLARRYGRSLLGERLVAAVPHGHWRTTTLIAGLRPTGVIAPIGSNDLTQLVLGVDRDSDRLKRLLSRPDRSLSAAPAATGSLPARGWRPPRHRRAKLCNPGPCLGSHSA